MEQGSTNELDKVLRPVVDLMPTLS